MTNHLDADTPYEPDPYASLLLQLEREIFRTATLLHADSRAIVETVRERYGLADEIRCGRGLARHGSTDRHASERLRRRRDDDDDDGVVLLFVGRLEPRKGIDTLLDAFAVLAPELPALRLVVVGPENLGEGEFRRPWLERHAGAEWLARSRFTGQVGDDELNERYRRADVVVLPSRYESFGLTVVEAMRHGQAGRLDDGGSDPRADRRWCGRDARRGRRHRRLGIGHPRAGRRPGTTSDHGGCRPASLRGQFAIGAAAERLSSLLSAVRVVRPDGGPLDAGEEISIETRAG